MSPAEFCKCGSISIVPLFAATEDRWTDHQIGIYCHECQEQLFTDDEPWIITNAEAVAKGYGLWPEMEELARCASCDGTGWHTQFKIFVYTDFKCQDCDGTGAICG